MADPPTGNSVNFKSPPDVHPGSKYSIISFTSMTKPPVGKPLLYSAKIFEQIMQFLNCFGFSMFLKAFFFFKVSGN